MDSKVLDASAFYAGVPFGSGGGPYYTTPLVMGEVAHIKRGHGALDALVDSGRLRVREPSAGSVRRAEEASRRTGDFGQLSEQDISVLALCLEGGGRGVVTDDFAVSNVAGSLGVRVHPVMTGGIRHRGVWIHYCPGCRRSFRGAGECPLCGAALRRKLTRREGVRGR